MFKILRASLTFSILWVTAAAIADDASVLENWMPVHADVFSGASPNGSIAFAELRRRGIRTIISVDGAPPDVENAKTNGLRYVHIPIGYDGIDEGTTRRLAKAIQELPKPIYFHCHHGKQRGPAAAVAGCIAAGRIDANRGTQWLRQAGTSPSYSGLYRSVESTTRLDDDLISRPTDFPETVAPDELVTKMLDIDERFTKLGKAFDRNADTDEHRHDALLIEEHYRELQRSKHGGLDSNDFTKRLLEAERTANELGRRLKQPAEQFAAPESVQRIYRKMGEQCKLCHQTFRD